jgi:hypothetical protein
MKGCCGTTARLHPEASHSPSAKFSQRVALEATEGGENVFEAVQSIDSRDRPGSPIKETHLGVFDTESEAVDAARTARASFFDAERVDFAWWIVRPVGAQLASWIADSNSDKEFVLDLRSGQLVER